MGVCKTTYVGPYVEVEKKLMEVNYGHRISPTTGKKYDDHVLFDQFTGEKLVWEKLVKTEYVGTEEYYDGFQLIWTNCISHQLLIPDSDSKCHGIFLDYAETFDVGAINMEEEKQKLAKEFASFFEKISELGFQYSIHFGVINYEN